VIVSIHKPETGDVAILTPSPDEIDQAFRALFEESYFRSGSAAGYEIWGFWWEQYKTHNFMQGITP